MKSYLKLFITVIFILVAVRTVKSDQITISGVVRYSDNNEIVTTGLVKCYNTETCELAGVGEIQPTGDYLLGVVRVLGVPHAIIGLPNIGEEDFVPTGYPDKTQSSQYVHVFVDQNLTGIDIYVQRTQGSGGMPFTANISGIVLDKNNMPMKDAIVYAKQGNSNYGFAITNSKGEYTINNISPGNYTISANRVSSKTNEMNVVLSENGLSNINFVMDKLILNTGKNTPVSFKLSQNYPNPFNPSTTIKYSVPVSSMVTLNIYNVVGELAAELVNESQDAGSYEISFDASSLSSGVYYYKLSSGSYSDTKKMTLIK